MNRYKELQEMQTTIKTELKNMTPPELWVCIFKENAFTPTAFTTENEAKNHCPSVVEKIVRYVLPESEANHE